MDGGEAVVVLTRFPSLALVGCRSGETLHASERVLALAVTPSFIVSGQLPALNVLADRDPSECRCMSQEGTSMLYERGEKDDQSLRRVGEIGRPVAWAEYLMTSFSTEVEIPQAKRDFGV